MMRSVGLSIVLIVTVFACLLGASHANVIRLKEKLVAAASEHAEASLKSSSHAAAAMDSQIQNHLFSSLSVSYGGYQYIPSLDQVGNDLGQVTSTTDIIGIEAVCDQSTNPRCVACNTGGWLKQSLGNPVSWTSSSTPGLYIKTFDTLYFGNSLSYTSGDHLISPSGTASFVAQTDSNLVIYNTATNVALWATNTNGESPSISVLTMQEDCNLVAYTASNVPIWASGTYERGTRCYARIFDNGNFAVFDGAGNQLWQTNTGVIVAPATTTTPLPNLNPVCIDVNTYQHLSPGDVLMQGINTITGGHFNFGYSFPVVPDIGIANGDAITTQQAACSSAPLNPSTEYIFLTLGSTLALSSTGGTGNNGVTFSFHPPGVAQWSVCLVIDPCDGSFFVAFGGDDLEINAGAVTLAPKVLALSPSQNIAFKPQIQLWMGNPIAPGQQFLQTVSFPVNFYCEATGTINLPPGLDESPLAIVIDGKVGAAWTNPNAAYGDIFKGAGGAFTFGLSAQASFEIKGVSTGKVGQAAITIPFATAAVVVKCADTINCGAYVSGSLGSNNFIQDLGIVLPNAQIGLNVGVYFFFNHTARDGDAWGILFDGQFNIAGYDQLVYVGLYKPFGGLVELCYAESHSGIANGNCIGFGCAKNTVTRSMTALQATCNAGDTLTGGVCYPPSCQAGYTDVAGICWQNCPPGYSDSGTTCYTLPDQYGKGCCCTVFGCCNVGCNDGYHDDGACLCVRPADSFAKANYRISYTANYVCPSGYVEEAGACYAPCPSGYDGVGAVCWQSCPSSYPVNNGAVCNMPGGIPIPGQMCPFN